MAFRNFSHAIPLSEPGPVSTRAGRKCGGTTGASVRVLAGLWLLCLVAGYAAAQKSKQPPAKPLDVNTATAAELQTVPGIGPAVANAIVKFREKSGPIRRLEDLLAVRGITRKKLEAWKKYLEVKS